VTVQPSSIPVRSNFRNDLRGVLARDLASKGFTVKPTDDVDRLLVLHLNVEHRRIPQRPRPAIWSNDLRAREGVLLGEQRRALLCIEGSSMRGDDLSPDLSRKVVGAKKKADFNDRLLCEWDAHHMHLGETLDPDGKIKGTKDVLFVLARNEALYFVDVLDHHAFAEQRIFDIVSTNWPHLSSPFAMIGCVGGERVSDEDRALARAAGINALTTGPDGSVHVPLGGGIATDGSSSRVRSQADRLLDRIEWIEAGCRANADDICENLAGMTGQRLDALHLRLIVTDGGVLRVLETQTGIEIRPTG
jgi:hypothetical protein